MRALVLVLLLAACMQGRSGELPEQWRALQITATPIDLGVEQIGRLRFRGGLVLTSDGDEFGGLSGLEVLDGNRVLIMNDDAEWFEAQLVLDAAGSLVGFTDLRHALMLNERGEWFPSKATGDSEGLTQLLDGRFAGSFEGTQSIRIFDMNRDGPFGPSDFGPLLAGTEDLPLNAGLEAIVTLSDGSLLVGAEGGERPTTPLWRVSLNATTPTEPLIGFPLRDGFSLTGLDRAPDGGIVAVERFYAPVIGARARIAYFPESALDAPGDVLPNVEILGEIAPPMPVDNFEGIATARNADGTTRIYIVSDDNYNVRQRTLIYAFDVVSESAR